PSRQVRAAMTEFERFERALQAAEKAGDVQAAQQLASTMRQMMLAQNPSLGEQPDVQEEAARLAAEGMTIPETLLVSAGRSLDKIGAGAQQLAHQARLLPGNSVVPRTPPELVEASKSELARLAREQREKDVAFSGLQKAHPIATAV